PRDQYGHEKPAHIETDFKAENSKEFEALPEHLNGNRAIRTLVCERTHSAKDWRLLFNKPFVAVPRTPITGGPVTVQGSILSMRRTSWSPSGRAMPPQFAVHGRAEQRDHRIEKHMWIDARFVQRGEHRFGTSWDSADVEWGRPLVCAGRPRPAVLSTYQAS